MKVLALNVGSSSVKYALFEEEQCLERGAGDAEALLAKKPDAVGHRLVHGGPRHWQPERVTPALLKSLREMVPFAPLHLPAELDLIEEVAAKAPQLQQVVCFDTAFHWKLPEVTRRLPLPRPLYDQGVRRYGFHGLSYEYLISKLEAPGRAVLAHLGNGASLAAVKDGAPVDTSMGMTPAGGVMMGTRSGDLDPGVLLHLLAKGFDARKLEQLVNHESGLRGVSGATNDVQKLLQQTDASAAMALQMFAYEIRKTIGAYAAALGGIDTLVFTGGIGEHAAPVRAGCCAGLEFLGVRIDAARNAASADVISTEDSRCVVRVIETDEERMIARHTLRVRRSEGP